MLPRIPQALLERKWVRRLPASAATFVAEIVGAGFVGAAVDSVYGSIAGWLAFAVSLLTIQVVAAYGERLGLGDNERAHKLWGGLAMLLIGAAFMLGSSAVTDRQEEPPNNRSISTSTCMKGDQLWSLVELSVRSHPIRVETVAIMPNNPKDIPKARLSVGRGPAGMVCNSERFLPTERTWPLPEEYAEEGWIGLRSTPIDVTLEQSAYIQYNNYVHECFFLAVDDLRGQRVFCLNFKKR